MEFLFRNLGNKPTSSDELRSSSQTTIEKQTNNEHIIDITDVNEDQHGCLEVTNPSDAKPNAIAGADEPSDVSHKGRFRLQFNSLVCVAIYN